MNKIDECQQDLKLLPYFHRLSDVLGAPGQLAYALGKLLGGPLVDACGGATSLVAILVQLGMGNPGTGH